MTKVFLTYVIAPCLIAAALLAFKPKTIGDTIIPSTAKCTDCVYKTGLYTTTTAASENRDAFKEAHKTSILVSSEELQERHIGGIGDFYYYEIHYTTSGACYKNGVDGL